ncbi:unnamed protein product [Lupinus luteus]|uniref:Uncharacterized protein n=1 Tax=Lupinus luteus TaxID=3873 RepID=A0AAV1YCG9_LUPLU
MGMAVIPDKNITYPSIILQDAFNKTLGRGNHSVYLKCVGKFKKYYLQEVGIYIDPISKNVMSSQKHQIVIKVP